MSTAETAAEPVVEIVVFDSGEANLYGRGKDGRIDYDRLLPLPRGWPEYVTSMFLDSRRIPWRMA